MDTCFNVADGHLETPGGHVETVVLWFEDIENKNLIKSKHIITHTLNMHVTNMYTLPY